MKDVSAQISKELPQFISTEVDYYFICHKKLWWFSHGLHMEQEHDRVKNEELDFLGP